MSFKFGGSTSKSTTTSSSTSKSTTTPIVPQWGSDLTQSVAGRIGSVNRLDPQNLVAPAQPLHNQAAAGAAALNGTSWNYDGAADLTRYAMNAQAPRTAGVRAAGYIDDYMNPYLKDVVDSSAADFDADAGRTRAQQALDLAGSGAFGGSGAALTQSLTEGELARARASTLSGLRSQGWQTALGAAQQDAERQQSANNLNAQLYAGQMDRALGAARQLTDISSQYEAGQRANIATQLAAADSLRGVDSEQRQAPVSSTQQVVAMLSGLPISLFTGSQTDTSSSSSQTSKMREFHADAEGKFTGIPGVSS